MSVKRTLTISILLTMTFPLLAAAQGSFERTFGGPDMELGYSVQQTADKGFVIVGSTLSFGSGSSDIYLVRTDEEGNETWSRTYGGDQSEVGYSVQQTPDGGFIIAGFTYSYGAGAGDVYLVRTDSSGDTLWTRTFGGSEFDWGYSVDQTTDGGYIVAGSTTSFGAETGDIYAVRTDSLGITIWARGYGGHQTEYARSVQQTTDGGFIIGGTTYSYGTTTGDVYIIKTDASGTSLWTKTYGQEGVDEGNCVIQTRDGGYIVVGEIYSPLSVSRDAYLVRMNASGDSLWARTYGGFDRDVGSSVRQTTDGGYVVVGYTESFGAGDRDLYLVRTDASGDTLWTRTYGGPEWDSGKSVGVTVDGGYVIVGDTESLGQGGRDLYLVKTNSIGYVGIDTDEPVVPTIPRSIVLSQNFPNPFNPTTTIAFEIPGNEGAGIPGVTGAGTSGDTGIGIRRIVTVRAQGDFGTRSQDIERRGLSGVSVSDAHGEKDQRQQVSLTIFDLRGRRVRVLVDSDLEPGSHQVNWDGKNDAGESVPSGVYLYRLESDSGVLTRKMSIAK